MTRFSQTRKSLWSLGCDWCF